MHCRDVCKQRRSTPLSRLLNKVISFDHHGTAYCGRLDHAEDARCLILVELQPLRTSTRGAPTDARCKGWWRDQVGGYHKPQVVTCSLYIQLWCPASRDFLLFIQRMPVTDNSES